MLKKLILGAMLAAAPALVPQAQAATLDCVNGDITLAMLMSSDGCQVGDKLFSNFDFRPTPLDAVPTADNVRVLGITENGLYGIQFEGAFFAGPGQLIDFVIEYMVTVLDQGMLLSDIHLQFNGGTSGTGFAAIEESVENMSGQLIGQASVDTSNPPHSLSDVALLTEQVKQAIVTKDILLVGGLDGTARISVVEQLTSQTPIPEPASMTLLGTGLVGVVRYARRRKKQ